MLENKRLLVIIMVSLSLALFLTQSARADLRTGRIDTGFDPGTGADSSVYAAVQLSDGRILIGGNFTTIDGTARNGMAKLNADGSLSPLSIGTGADDRVRAIAVQPDSKILVVGDFTTFNNIPRSGIVRLHADGTLDLNFNPGAAANGDIYDIALQPDGKIVICGAFTTFNGVSRNRVARLNANGSLDTSFDPAAGPNETVEALALAPDGRIYIGGWFTGVNGITRGRIARLTATGALDSTFDHGTGANDVVTDLALLPTGQIIIVGNFTLFDGVSRSRVAGLESDGSLWLAFDPGTGTNGPVWTVAALPDDGIIIGGSFSSVNGVSRNRIARLDLSGNLKLNLDPGGGPSGSIWVVAPQADGKVLIGGNFTSVDGVSRNRVARLNADGTLDAGLDTGGGTIDLVYTLETTTDQKMIIAGDFTTFDGSGCNRVARLNADGSFDQSYYVGAGPNDTVFSSALQDDGKLVLGGDFTQVGVDSRNRIARLREAGTLDSSFDPGTGANERVNALAVQDDGKIVAVGRFTNFNGITRGRLERLNPDGSQDAFFNTGTGANDSIDAVAIQADGKILVGGWFSSFNGTGANRLARLNSDGSLDTSFNTGTGFIGQIEAIALQSDGKIIVAGGFTIYNGTPINRIARLNSDGSLDTSFAVGSGFNSYVWSLLIQPDDKILAVGAFTNYNGISRRRIARLNPNGSLDTNFDVGNGADNQVHGVAIQPNGKIVIAGQFDTFDGQIARDVTRLNGGTSPKLTGTSGAPPIGDVGDPYSFTFTAGGFPAPEFYTHGDFPPGLQLDAETGVVSGTPTAAGHFAFVLGAHNYISPNDSTFATIEIIDTNDPPIAINDSGTGFETDKDSVFTTASVLANDTDPEGDSLSVQSFDTTGTQGLITSNGDGTFSYDPNGQFDHLGEGQSAADSFTYIVSDGEYTDTATVTITIYGGNIPPTAVDDSGTGFGTDEDTVFTTASVLANDSDPDGDSISLQSFDTPGTSGLVTSNGDGTFNYDPNGQFDYLSAGQSATDTFTYTVSDGNGGSDTATVTITITGQPDQSQFAIYLPMVVR